MKSIHFLKKISMALLIVLYGVSCTDKLSTAEKLSIEKNEQATIEKVFNCSESLIFGMGFLKKFSVDIENSFNCDGIMDAKDYTLSSKQGLQPPEYTVKIASTQTPEIFCKTTSHNLFSHCSFYPKKVSQQRAVATLLLNTGKEMSKYLIGNHTSTTPRKFVKKYVGKMVLN